MNSKPGHQIEELSKSIQQLITLNKEFKLELTDTKDEIHQIIYKKVFLIKNVLTNNKLYEENINWQFILQNDFEFAKLIVVIWSKLASIYSEFVLIRPNSATTLIDEEEKQNADDADFNQRNFSIFQCMCSISLTLTKNQYLNDEMLKFNVHLAQIGLINQLIAFFDQKNMQRQENFSNELIILVKIIRNMSKNPIDKYVWQTCLDVEKKLRESSLMKNNVPEFRKTLNGLIQRMNQKTPAECLEYFSTLSSPEEIIESKQAYIDIFLLKKLLKKPIFDNFQIFVDLNCIEIFSKLMLEFFKIKAQLDYKAYKETIDDANEAADLNERKISIFDSLLFIINKLAFKSINLGLYFNKKSFIKIFYDFAMDEQFIKNTIGSIKNNVFSNLTILVLYSDENKIDWLETISIDSLIGILEKTPDGYVSRQISILISYLANDEQIQQLKQIETYSNELLKHLELIARKFEANEPLRKIKCEYLTESKRMIKDLYSSHFNGMLTGTLNLMIRLSINQNEKKKFYFNGINSTKTIIFMGNDLEKYFALKLLAQLCFDKEISNEISKDKKLIDYLISFNMPDSNLIHELKAVCQTIIWLIKQNEIVIIDNFNCDEQKIRKEKHIMISYSWSTQQECIAVKNELQKLNYKIWMDIDQMHGSTMDTMAKSIEEAYCVLICVCEKYKLSENCQLEAKYASKLKKPMIPLILQNGYQTCDGWLGFLISDKIFIDFRSKRYSFKDCINKLDHEIKKILNIIGSISVESSSLNCKHENEQTNSIEIFSSNQQNSKKIMLVECWNSIQVNSWLTENKIHKKITESFLNLDGACLKQLYDLSKQNPQFVYQTLINESNNELKLLDIIFFITRVSRLFDK